MWGKAFPCRIVNKKKEKTLNIGAFVPYFQIERLQEGGEGRLATGERNKVEQDGNYQ